MEIKLNGWKVQVTVDEDNHLTVAIAHEDGTTPEAFCADIENPGEWVERFTTPQIEKDYQEG